MKNYKNRLSSFDVLSPSILLSNKELLKDITYWKKVLNRPNGWHYDLDIIWILNTLKKSNLKPGDWILDAGAGQGLLQFILVSKGYNVISFDYSKRKVLYRAKNIFNIDIDNGNTKYDHNYMSHIKYAPNKKNLKSLIKYFKDCGIKVFIKNIFRWVVYYFYFLIEKLIGKKSRYGDLKMIRGSFQDLCDFNFEVKAVVSLSAIEHCDKEEILVCLENMFKKTSNGPLIITTSIHEKYKDKYEDYFQSWTFGKQSLLDIFNLSINESTIEDVRDQILKSDLIWDRLDSYYFQRKNSYFLNKIIKDIPYIPVGIIYK